MSNTPKTLYDKIWDSHVVGKHPSGADILYIDQQFLHEVTSAPAFDYIDQSGLGVRRPEATLAVADHNVPTHPGRTEETDDPLAAEQLRLIRHYTSKYGIQYFSCDDRRQGIVHVVGPEQGLTQPGMTIVCGDSHTSTHGAFGALAFGISTSEIEHVLATQTLLQQKSKTMNVHVVGHLSHSVSAKDLALYLIGIIGTAGATEHVIEFTGLGVTSLSMEGRMTLCNMAIEAGARAGMVAPDEKTCAYLKGRPHAPDESVWDQAVAYWSGFRSDTGATYDSRVELDASAVRPMVTWGTSPEDVVSIEERVPDPAREHDENRRRAMEMALHYMGLEPGQPMTDIRIDRVFIGSCTNGRIEDLRAAAQMIKGMKVHDNVRAMVVPGSGIVAEQAEREGLDRIFLDAGFEWREPGCSMCLGMNPDRLAPGERCASTSNRNFMGRQGPGGRTHLVSPAMAAAAAIAGRFVDIREMDPD